MSMQSSQESSVPAAPESDLTSQQVSQAYGLLRARWGEGNRDQCVLVGPHDLAGRRARGLEVAAAELAQGGLRVMRGSNRDGILRRGAPRALVSELRRAGSASGLRRAG